MLGSYVIDVKVGSFPQKIASGFDLAFKGLTGADYKPIAYLGHQLVGNSTNHAILCEQNLITREDIRNIVIVTINEKAGDLRGETLSVVDIKRVLCDKGQKFGGITISPTTEISSEAMKVFKKHFGENDLFGASNKPFAILATQIVNGIAYFFAVESTMFVAPMSENGVVISSGNNKSVVIVKMFEKFDEIQTKVILEGSAPIEEGDTSETSEDKTLGKVIIENNKKMLDYAFNW